MIQIDRIDHLVLTVGSIQPTCEFYARVLGMEVAVSESRRVSLKFGRQKINLHERGHEFDPKAALPTPGSSDLCLIITGPLAPFLQHLENAKVTPIEGPVRRSGATGDILSVYFRDPDENLIEVSTYDE